MLELEPDPKKHTNKKKEQKTESTGTKNFMQYLITAIILTLIFFH